MSDAAGPVFLTEGPDGALYYADLEGGTIRRIASDSSAPTARIAANPTTGAAPLDVAFDGRGSSDPEGDTLTYAWDLDGDGDFNDSTAATANFTYAKPGAVTVRLRVSDPNGRHGTASTVITAGGPPTVTITAPSAATTWAVGDTISFSGSARTSAGEALAAKDLVWSLSMRHCPSNCHTHPIENYVGVTSGSLVAPDHEYPSHLLLSLTATDSAGLSATETVRLDPRTANIALNSSPPGLALSFASETLTTPATRTVIARSETTVSAPSSQLLGAARYLWRAWNDGLAQSHEITAPASGTASYTATYAPETSATPSPEPTATPQVSVTPAPSVTPVPSPPATPKPAGPIGLELRRGPRARPLRRRARPRRSRPRDAARAEARASAHRRGLGPARARRRHARRAGVLEDDGHRRLGRHAVRPRARAEARALDPSRPDLRRPDDPALRQRSFRRNPCGNRRPRQHRALAAARRGASAAGSTSSGSTTARSPRPSSAPTWRRRRSVRAFQPVSEETIWFRSGNSPTRGAPADPGGRTPLTGWSSTT